MSEKVSYFFMIFKMLVDVLLMKSYESKQLGLLLSFPEGVGDTAAE